MLKDLIRKARNKDEKQSVAQVTEAPLSPPFYLEECVTPLRDVEIFSNVVAETYEDQMMKIFAHASKTWKKIGVGGSWRTTRRCVWRRSYTSRSYSRASSSLLGKFMWATTDVAECQSRSRKRLPAGGRNFTPYWWSSILSEGLHPLAWQCLYMFTFNDEDKVCLPARSLLVFQGEAYRGQHSISESTWDRLDDTTNFALGSARREGNILHRGLRVSLTLRYVPLCGWKCWKLAREIVQEERLGHSVSPSATPLH